MAFLRSHPEILFNKESSLAFSKERLADVIVAYKNNEPKKAYRYAVEAYLEGFELVEQNINAFDKTLRLEIEIAMTGLSFIAVYREAFETILFYQALWAQTDEASSNMAFAGFLTAVGVPAVLGWLIMRYSVRLPLREFFAVTGGLMFVLAVIFAGKGIAALQEAGVIIYSPVDFIRIDILGIYPNLQGLLVQLALIIIAIFLWNKKTTKT